MKHTLVTYVAKPEAVAENERLIAAVFRELREKAPKGMRYVVLRQGERFVHFSSVEDGSTPVTALDAFRAFQADIKSRAAEGPKAGDAVVAGNYGMLGE